MFWYYGFGETIAFGSDKKKWSLTLSKFYTFLCAFIYAAKKLASQRRRDEIVAVLQTQQLKIG